MTIDNDNETILSSKVIKGFLDVAIHEINNKEYAYAYDTYLLIARRVEIILMDLKGKKNVENNDEVNHA